MIDLKDLRRTFRELYPSNHNAEPRLFRAPGRVNLIGEHTDYNDGFVLPMAIEHETVVAACARADRRIRVHTLNLNRSAEFDLDVPHEPKRERGEGWTGYVEGMARSLEHDGARLRGADLLLISDVPVGAGLSSSAALEISIGFALLSLSGVEIDRTKLALAGQRAEHEFTGARTGIMDQFIAARGRAGHALLIDCRSLEAVPVPLDTERCVIAICDTGVKHSLASSEYNRRREECEQGVRLLAEFLPNLRALRDVSVPEFEEYEARLPDVIRRRCRHVITENDRTLEAVAALREGRLQMMGELMYASHASLRDDYEVSSRELDVMVEAASEIPGVYGARMTGGGFGGCTVNLVERSAIDNFRQKIASDYARATNREAAIYVSSAAAGASEITKQESGVRSQEPE